MEGKVAFGPQDASPQLRFFFYLDKAKFLVTV